MRSLQEVTTAFGEFGCQSYRTAAVQVPDGSRNETCRSRECIVQIQCGAVVSGDIAVRMQEFARDVLHSS